MLDCPEHSVPVPIAPAGDITDTTPTFSWESVPYAAEYRLFVRNFQNVTLIDQWYTAADCGEMAARINRARGQPVQR